MQCSRLRFTGTLTRALLTAVRSTANLASLQDGLGGVVRVDCKSDIAVITMERGENRMNDDFTDQVHAALDDVLKQSDVRAVITTGQGKFYCNGLDLPWLSEINNTSPEDLKEFVSRWRSLLERVLTFPLPTLAAVNGHAFAGGGLFSLCHDYRVMQSDRGWWCLNEAHFGMQFPDFIVKLLRMKLGGNGARTLTDAAFCGKRYGGEEAKRYGIVDDTAPEAELIAKAEAILNASIPAEGLSRDFVSATKKHFYDDILKASSVQGPESLDPLLSK